MKMRMKNMTHTRTLIKQADLVVQAIEWFKELTGFSEQDLLGYMNKYNIWNILNDSDYIDSLVWATEKDILDLFGRYLTDEEKEAALKRIDTDIYGADGNLIGDRCLNEDMYEA